MYLIDLIYHQGGDAQHARHGQHGQCARAREPALAQGVAESHAPPPDSLFPQIGAGTTALAKICGINSDPVIILTATEGSED